MFAMSLIAMLSTEAVTPTDGLWRGAMHAIQDPGLLSLFPQAAHGFPFLAATASSVAFLGWVAAWVLALGGLTVLPPATGDAAAARAA